LISGPEKGQSTLTSDKELAAMGKLAKRIREDSRSFSKRIALSAIRRNEHRKDEGLQDLTSFHRVINEFPRFSSIDSNILMDHFSRDDACEDISAATAPDGDVYFYSNLYIPRETVKALVRREERIADIANRVRETSIRSNRLTDMESLVDVFPDLSHDDLDTHMAHLVNDTRYADIRALASATGAVYLYSKDFIPVETAMALLRTEDILAAMA